MSGHAVRRVVAGGLAVASMAACIGGTLPPREMYRLAPMDTTAVARALAGVGGTPALQGTLEVEPYTTSGLYGDVQIVYRIGEAQYASYTSREWAIPLSIMLATRTAEALQTASFTSGPVLAEPGGRVAHDYEWRGTVREFEEVDRGREVFAAVHLDGSLVRAADQSVLWRGSTRVERRVDQPTMNAIVATLSSLADSAIVDLARQAGRALQAPGAEAASRADQAR